MAQSRALSLSMVPHVPHWSLDLAARSQRTVAQPPWGQQTGVGSGLELCPGIQRPLSRAHLCLSVSSRFPVKGGFGSCRPPGPRGESRVFNRDGDWSVQLVSEPPDRWGLHAGSAVLGARAAPCPPPGPLPGGSPSPWAAAPHAFLTPLCQGVVPGRVGAAPVLTRRQAAHPAKGTDQVRSPELPDGGPGVPG